MFIKHIFVCLSLVALLLGLSGCAVEPVEHFLTGTVISAVTGASLVNTTVTFGSTSIVTGADGKFSFSLGTAGGTSSGVFSFYKTGYTAYYFNTLSIDTDSDCSICIPLRPLSSGPWSERTFSGKIYYSDGISQPIDSTSFTISIASEKGLSLEYEEGTYNGGFSVPTYVRAANCMLVVTLRSGTDITHFGFSTNNNLSGALPTANITLRDPLEPDLISNVTFNAYGTGANGYIGCLLQNTFYPVVVRSGGYYKELNLDFSSSSSNTIDLVNLIPGSQLFMIQMGTSTLYGHSNILYGVGTAAIPSSISSVNLPAVSDNGPIVAVDPATLAYSSGTLSLNAVTGANLYCFYLVQDGTTFPIAVIYSFTNSTDLPSWLTALLSTKTIDFQILAMNQTNYMRLEKLQYCIYGGTFLAPGDQYSGDDGTRDNFVFP